MGRFKPRHTIRKKKTVKERIFTTVVVVAFIATIVGVTSKYVKRTKDFFVEYENATTLVEVKCTDGLFSYYAAVGFIDDDVYEKYQNNEYTGSTIEIYHPYIRGKSVLVDVTDVRSIKTKTYTSFYRSHPPRE